MKIHFIGILFILIPIQAFSQNKIDLKAFFDVDHKQISISQTIQFKNNTQTVLDTIFLSNWANSYATKKTPLAERIQEEYINDFHLAKNKDRGYSVVTSITQNNQGLHYQELKNHPDILQVVLLESLKPGDRYTLKLNYIVKLPNAKFTDYGVTENGNWNLKYWYITPAIYNKQWHYYSNKNLDDLFIPKSDICLEIEYPNDYTVTSELDVINTVTLPQNQMIELCGENRVCSSLFFSKTPDFKTLKVNAVSVISNIKEDHITGDESDRIIKKVIGFITSKFGEYPHKKFLLSQIDYDNNPVYGLNFLPSFIKLYPSHFKYELMFLKIALQNYLENTLLINPRKDQWLTDGILIYYLMNYVDQYYPDMKFLGSFANAWGVRSFQVSKMLFNNKYTLAYMLMARTNRDQSLSMPKDSLLKFNSNISNKYKAGIGLKYLDAFTNHTMVEKSIETFIVENKLIATDPRNFELLLKSKTNKDINWFFEDYLKTRKKIDFKIKKIIKTKDSLSVMIKNKGANSMPVSLYSLGRDQVLSKLWIENIDSLKTVTIPRTNVDKLVLNYNNEIPEINLRDNWRAINGTFLNNKPLQFRLFRDIESPNFNQMFLLPTVQFNNIYDGATLGIRVYNKTILKKRFDYKIEPRYALKSRSITGSAFVSNTHYFDNNLYSVNYGLFGGYSSYAKDLFVRKITPSLTLNFRNNEDFRSNDRQLLLFRYVDIHRDKDPQNAFTSTEPNYGIFNLRYIHSNDNLIHFNKWYSDFQIGAKFCKLSVNYEYRHLFENNRQLNIRGFGGAFLKNNTNSDYFSFALDRPTDYLFDYNYLGRSEASGLFSQQYIAAEGGFKSKLEIPFANQWMTTFNMSTTLWKYVLAYADMGFIKNKSIGSKFVYDSGVRIDLVTDYFEIYFPFYSNLGWEINHSNYDQKIRFKFTVDPKILLGLFRRRWY